MISLTGCSLKSRTNTVYIKLKPFRFTRIDVNLPKVQEASPLNLRGKVKFTDPTNTKIEMDTKLWYSIRVLSHTKTKIIYQERIQKEALRRALDGMLDQVDRYNAYIKEQSND